MKLDDQIGFNSTAMKIKYFFMCDYITDKSKT